MASISGTRATLPTQLRQLIQRQLDSSDLELPVLPSTASQVLETCNDPDADARELAELISRDQSLAGHVLKVANSAAYAPTEPIASLVQAASRLGMAAVCEIVVALAIQGRVFSVPGQQVRIRSLWMHSAAAGLYAKEIARTIRHNVEGAFVCGLLHDSGKPLVMKILVDLASRKTDRPVPAPILEAAMTEFHAEVGARMVEQWKLADWMVEAVRHHHDYASAPQHKTEAMLTCLADVFCHWALDHDKSEQDFEAEHPVITDLDVTAQDIVELQGRRGHVLELIESFL